MNGVPALIREDQLRRQSPPGPVPDARGSIHGDKALALSFVERYSLPFGIHAANVPAGLNFPALAAYGIASIRVSQDIRQDCVWSGYKAVLGPNDSSNTGEDTDVAAGGAVNWAQWGSNKFERASVVIGVNLTGMGVRAGLWSAWPLTFAGHRATSTQALRQTSHKPERTCRLAFYPDDINITATNAYPRQVWQETFLPAGFRLQLGDTLDVAFVCDPSVVNGVNGGAGARFLQVQAFGELHISMPNAFNVINP